MRAIRTAARTTTRTRTERRRAPRPRLSRAHRQEPRRRQRARSCWPTAAAPTIDPASPLAREPFLAVAELTGSAAQGRILSAAPITLAEIEARFADRIEAREEIAFDAASASLRGRKSRRLGAIALAEQPMPVAADDETAQDCSPTTLPRSASTGCRGRKALKQWRDRVMFLRASEGDEWPDLSDAALAADRERLARAGARRQDRARRDHRRTNLEQRLHDALALGAAAPARRRGADPFRGADRLARADRLRGRRRTENRDPGAGTVRPRPPSRRSPAAESRW